ncbi:hypothetical protein B0T25DRAFT_48673 [Lasiosphaeria hispida]|uniref:Uncharacterized protein n=1 Tax=Lasiosphaeria hispida TaxID=260671 RepID=A0AAJ0HVS9_9PEZI|nr:hypothetical protein B0T25DRAFT_48673 [Lasiosphaeria hispida]
MAVASPDAPRCTRCTEMPRVAGTLAHKPLARHQSTVAQSARQGTGLWTARHRNRDQTGTQAHKHISAGTQITDCRVRNGCCTPPATTPHALPSVGVGRLVSGCLARNPEYLPSRRIPSFAGPGIWDAAALARPPSKPRFQRWSRLPTSRSYTGRPDCLVRCLGCPDGVSPILSTAACLSIHHQSVMFWLRRVMGLHCRALC